MKILGALGITASPSAITLAIEQPYKEGHTGSLSDLAALIGWLQSIASSYLSYRDYENGPRFKELRRNLRRIASEGLLPFPPHYRERLISWHQLKPLLKTFDQIKKNADQILNELPPRGPLPKEAIDVFVDELAEVYDWIKDYSAAKVGKQRGPFERFVRAALKPIDPHATTGIARVIDRVVEKRRERAQKAGQPRKFSP